MEIERKTMYYEAIFIERVQNTLCVCAMHSA